MSQIENCPDCGSDNLQWLTEDAGFCHVCEWEQLPELPVSGVNLIPEGDSGESEPGISFPGRFTGLSLDLEPILDENGEPTWGGNPCMEIPPLPRQSPPLAQHIVGSEKVSINGVQIEKFERYDLSIALGVMPIGGDEQFYSPISCMSESSQNHLQIELAFRDETIHEQFEVGSVVTIELTRRSTVEHSILEVVTTIKECKLVLTHHTTELEDTGLIKTLIEFSFETNQSPQMKEREIE